METVLPFRDASLLFIVMAVTLQSLARIHQYFLTGLFQRKTIGVIFLVASGAQSALVILAALLDTGVTGILGATALAALVELPLSRAASKSRGAFVAQDPSSPLPQDLVRDARRFGLTSFLEKLLSYLNSPFFVVFLIAALGAAQDVAFFTVAAEFTMRVASTLSVPFSGITLPLFSAVDARKDPRQSASILRLYVMLMILLFIPMAALLTSVAPFLLPLVYGIRYSEAVPILQLFVPLLFLEYTVYSALRAALMTRGRYKQLLIAKLPLLVGVPALGRGRSGRCVRRYSSSISGVAALDGHPAAAFSIPGDLRRQSVTGVGRSHGARSYRRTKALSGMVLSCTPARPRVGFLSRSLPGVRRDGR